MKKIRIWFTALMCMAFLPVLNAQKYEDGLIDKTVAVIGNEAIFLSQIESEVKMAAYQGIVLSRCQVLELMLVQKLFLTQAKIDSLPVNYEQVERELNGRLSHMLATVGGEREAEAYFGKPLYKISQEWRKGIEENLLVEDMKRKISGKVGTMSPSEVKRFYNRTSKDSLPMMSTQYQFKQIVMYPQQEDAVLKVKSRLLEFRNRVLNGEKFSTLASLYSEDRESAIRGGELKMNPAQNFWSPFANAAMALNPGQVSQIVETPDGFHIIQMIEKDGDRFNARHILLRPVFTGDDRKVAMEKLDSVRTEIMAGNISFEAAAMRYSQDDASKVNGGLVADERTGSAYFEKDMLKPEDYRIISGMKEGDVSKVFESRDNEGRAGHLVYKIIKLEKIIPAHIANIEQDYNVLLEAAMQRASSDQIEKFVSDKIQTTYIRIDDMFKKCRFEREGWIK